VMAGATPVCTSSALAAGAVPTVLGTIGAAVGGHILARAMAKPDRVRDAVRQGGAQRQDGVRGASPSIKLGLCWTRTRAAPPAKHKAHTGGLAALADQGKLATLIAARDIGPGRTALPPC
jgi:hypothetical protein